jgi:peptidoglycan/LPS O-acetylase OafA/YrhL
MQSVPAGRYSVSPSPVGRVAALDALRGVAILSVLLFHFYKPTGHAALDLIAKPFATAGWAGVDVFFVLSGYLVGGIILRETAATGTLDWRRFFFRRALRLWPVLYIYLFALLLMGYDWHALWPAFLQVQNFADGTPSHLWSLAVEEHFYLAAAAVLPWAVRLSPKRTLVALVGLIVATAILRIGALIYGVSPLHAQWQTQFRIDALAVGVLLAALQHFHPALFVRIAGARRGLLIVALGAFAILASGLPPVLQWGPGLIAAWLMGASLVLLAVGREQAPNPIVSSLARLGLIAYPLYIWHASIGQAAETIARQVGITDQTGVLALQIAAAMVVALMIHRLVEAPFLALRNLSRPRGRLPRLEPA